MPNILIELPDDRRHYGWLRLVDSNGEDIMVPVQCLGRADSTQFPSNPSSDPTVVGGNTPTGGYEVIGLRMPSNADDAYMHGSNGKLVLKPISGQAEVAAQNGRTGLEIHGGFIRNGMLRPTSGCIRVSDASMKQLLNAMRAHEQAVQQCDAISVEINNTPQGAGLSEEAPDDPPSSVGNLLPVPHASPKPLPATPINPSPPGLGLPLFPPGDNLPVDERPSAPADDNDDNDEGEDDATGDILGEIPPKQIQK